MMFGVDEALVSARPQCVCGTVYEDSLLQLYCVVSDSSFKDTTLLVAILFYCGY
jgi:hypothetical protein